MDHLRSTVPQMPADHMPRGSTPDSIQTILQNALAKLGCKGALVAVSVNGRVTTHSVGSISANDHNRPFYIYSISKTFTAVAIMKLCEDQGTFLDEPVSPYFPNRQLSDAITTRHLLNHTSGLSDYFSSADYRQAVYQ